MNNFSLYVVTVLIWGSTWLVINFQLGVVAPEVSIFYRYALAALILFAWSAMRGLKMAFGIRAHVYFTLMGIFMFSFNYMVTYSAQQYIPSALNAVVFSTMMWMNVLYARLFFGTHIEPRVYVAAALGVLGLLILFWPSISSINLTDRTLLGAGLSLSGAVMASLGNMVSHQAQGERLPIVQSNAWGMLYGALITAGVVLLRDLPFDFEFTAAYIGSLLYLTVAGSIIAFGSYLKLLGRVGPHKAGYAMVMFPVVAVLLSVLFENLAVEWHLVLGMALVLTGNLAILGMRRTVRWMLRPANKAAKPQI
jgi:drug/metabolite transporter (DMT)-like permease